MDKYKRLLDLNGFIAFREFVIENLLKWKQMETYLFKIFMYNDLNFYSKR